ncbi:MAG TPA: hypothetical protein PK745_14420, partial [bacterium]|nr:hypothetical protein [bacterium]
MRTVFMAIAAIMVAQCLCDTKAFCGVPPERHVMFSINYGKAYEEEADNEIYALIPKEPKQEGISSYGPGDFWVDELENVYFSTADKIKKFDKEGHLIFTTRNFGKISGNYSQNQNMIFVTCGAIYADFLYWIVQMDIDTGEIVTSEKTGYNERSKYNDTHLGRVVSSSIPDFQYNNDMMKRPPFVDKYGYRYEYERVYTGGKELVIKKYHHVKDYDKTEYRIDLEKHLATIHERYYPNQIPNIFIDGEGRFYMWAELDIEEPKRLDEYGHLEYKSDLIVQHFDGAGNVVDELIFLGSGPFDLGNLRTPIRFAPNGDFYTIYFHLDKLDVVKYTWEHNKNKEDNVSK